MVSNPKIMRKIFILFALLISFFSCKEQDEEPVIFSGITERDEFGVMYSEDSTDWQLFDHWNSTEKALFENSKRDFCDTTEGEFSVIVYPNPCSNMLIINFMQSGTKQISLRLVDQDFNVLFSKDTTISSSLFINPGYLAFNGDLIRLYYKFSSDDCELRGHGDIRVIRQGN